jgi:uncharacterized protein (TIGR02271 family)
MLSEGQVQHVIGRDAYSQDGEKIGKVGQVFLDDDTNQPEFATVNTGFFGSNENFVPLAEATASEAGLTVPFSKSKVKDAPNVSTEQGHPSQDDERQLYEYYGMSYSESRSDSGLPAGTETAGPAAAGTAKPGTAAGGGLSAGDRDRDYDTAAGVTGRDVSGATTDDAMTRSEERLEVGTRRQEVGRARLRKYVVTEQEQVTVPVSKERVTIEREPITDANIDEATSGPEISEGEHEVVLHEETPVVEKRTEPVERVRLAKEEQVAEQQVSEEVRKERIEAEGDAGDTDRSR